MRIGYLSLAYSLLKMSMQMGPSEEEERMETEMGTYNPPASSLP